jgi:hypothetical protein
MTETDLAYIAGFADGEGCFKFRAPPESSFMVEIAQKNRRVLDWIHTQYPQGRVKLSRQQGFQIHRFVLTCRKDIAEFLHSIIPYLKEKNRQARLLLFACRLTESARPRTGVGRKYSPLIRRALVLLSDEITKEKH